jgi:hypothetical protein
MASTEWSNEDIDRIFEAVTAAIFDAHPIDEVAAAIKSANASSVWSEVVYEDILDAEYIED